MACWKYWGIKNEYRKSNNYSRARSGTSLGISLPSRRSFQKSRAIFLFCFGFNWPWISVIFHMGSNILWRYYLMLGFLAILFLFFFIIFIGIICGTVFFAILLPFILPILIIILILKSLWFDFYKIFWYNIFIR